jgi:hypothetical protein
VTGAEAAAVSVGAVFGVTVTLAPASLQAVAAAVLPASPL